MIVKREKIKRDQKNYAHEIPFVYVTVFHWQSDPIIEGARTIVTMQPGRYPMAKRNHRPGQTVE